MKTSIKFSLLGVLAGVAKIITHSIDVIEVAVAMIYRELEQDFQHPDKAD